LYRPKGELGNPFTKLQQQATAENANGIRYLKPFSTAPILKPQKEVSDLTREGIGRLTLHPEPLEILPFKKSFQTSENTFSPL
jgi:hypothetical protein